MGATDLTASHGLRVVLDTNVVLSALVFSNGRLAQLRGLWQTGAFVPLTCFDAVHELIRVLSYPKFKLDAAQRDSLLADYLPYAQVIDRFDRPLLATLPVCRDPKDQLFLNLALGARANFLVTGDDDLLCLNGQLAADNPFNICTPQQLLANLKLP